MGPDSEKRGQDVPLEVGTRIQLDRLGNWQIVDNFAPQTEDSKAAKHYWLIKRVLPHGGFGLLYLVTNECQKPGVLKVPRHRHIRPDLLEQFQREPKYLAHMELRNDYTVGLLDQGTLPPPINLPFFVMEHLKGRSLIDYIRESGALAERKVIWFGYQIASALAAAHEREMMLLDPAANESSITGVRNEGAGIIHRDVTPGNILLDRERENARLGDFGSAIQIGGKDVRNVPPMANQTYASPELGSRWISEASDIYQLGLTLCTAWTGIEPHGPFHSDIRDRLPRPESALAELLLAMTEPQAETRPDAEAVRDRFRALILSSDPVAQEVVSTGIQLPATFTAGSFITRLVFIAAAVFLLCTVLAEGLRLAGISRLGVLPAAQGRPAKGGASLTGN